MKARTSVTKIGALVLSAGLLVSCGKSNKVSSSLNRGIGGGTSSSPVVAGNHGADVQDVKNYYGCQYGSRLQDFTFSTQSFDANNVWGPYAQGAISGEVTDVFVGVNDYTNDLIIVSKVTSGPNVIGYNVTLSICPDNAITPGSSISNLRNYSGRINLDGDNYCNLGNVDFADMVAHVQNQYSYDERFSFSSHCNGGNYRQ